MNISYFFIFRNNYLNCDKKINIYMKNHEDLKFKKMIFFYKTSMDIDKFSKYSKIYIEGFF